MYPKWPFLNIYISTILTDIFFSVIFEHGIRQASVNTRFDICSLSPAHCLCVEYLYPCLVVKKGILYSLKSM